ncbi:MAG: cation diffusion facilitator family transporter, partial [bacterium]
GLTSLAVLAGALGVWLGYPLADPLVGLGITAAILGIVWQSARAIFTRMLDGVDPDVIDELAHAAHHVSQVQDVTDVRARWLGHRLHAEVSIAVKPEISVSEAHAVALEVHHQLLHHVPHLAEATIHIDPITAAGDRHHRVTAHVHDGLPAHSH